LCELPCEQQGRTARPPTVVCQRDPAARGIDRDGAEEFAQLSRTTGIERTIRAAREARNTSEGFRSFRIAAFVKNKNRYSEQPELACLVAKRVDILLHAVADEDERIDPLSLCLGDGKLQDPADLRLAAEAGDRAHILQ